MTKYFMVLVFCIQFLNSPSWAKSQNNTEFLPNQYREYYSNIISEMCRMYGDNSNSFLTSQHNIQVYQAGIIKDISKMDSQAAKKYLIKLEEQRILNDGMDFRLSVSINITSNDPKIEKLKIGQKISFLGRIENMTADTVAIDVSYDFVDFMNVYKKRNTNIEQELIRNIRSYTIDLEPKDAKEVIKKIEIESILNP